MPHNSAVGAEASKPIAAWSDGYWIHGRLTWHASGELLFFASRPDRNPATPDLMRLYRAKIGEVPIAIGYAQATSICLLDGQVLYSARTEESSGVPRIYDMGSATIRVPEDVAAAETTLRACAVGLGPKWALRKPASSAETRRSVAAGDRLVEFIETSDGRSIHLRHANASSEEVILPIDWKTMVSGTVMTADRYDVEDAEFDRATLIYPRLSYAEKLTSWRQSDRLAAILLTRTNQRREITVPWLPGVEQAIYRILYTRNGILVAVDAPPTRPNARAYVGLWRLTDDQSYERIDQAYVIAESLAVARDGCTIAYTTAEFAEAAVKLIAHSLIIRNICT